MSSETTLLETLNYTPVRSQFGTSGVRALVTDLTDLEVYCLTLGTLHYLQDSGKLQRSADATNTIPLAGDLRASTDRLLRASAQAIRDAGHKVDYAGRIPTPALSFHALEHGVASFVVTGSHIPVDRNGQKANRCDGEVLKSDEQGISAAVEAMRQQEFERPAGQSLFTTDGMFKPEYQPELPPVDERAARGYRARYQQVFPGDALRGQRIVFFQYAAVGRDLLPEILEGLGAEVLRTGRSDQFVPLDTEAISDGHLAMLADIVAEQRRQHGRIDALVSTDGDSDRPLLIGVDESDDDKLSLRFFPGDLLGAVVADYLDADSVAVPISVNPAVHEFFAAKGINTSKTRIGSPYVIQAIQQALAEGRKRVVAWEANGGFLLGSDIELRGATLKALPTRDALLPLLCALHAAAAAELPLARVFERLPRWYGRADLIDDFPREISQRILTRYTPAEPEVDWLVFEAERIVLRDAAEEVIGEWPLQDPRAQQALIHKRELESVFSAAHGFDKINRICTLDGIRCFFRNDDIAHIRPSGNAPQLRIYAHARSQTRADAIVRAGVAEPDGLLRQLQRLIEKHAG